MLRQVAAANAATSRLVAELAGSASQGAVPTWLTGSGKAAHSKPAEPGPAGSRLGGGADEAALQAAGDVPNDEEPPEPMSEDVEPAKEPKEPSVRKRKARALAATPAARQVMCSLAAKVALCALINLLIPGLEVGCLNTLYANAGGGSCQVLWRAPAGQEAQAALQGCGRCRPAEDEGARRRRAGRAGRPRCCR